MDIMKAVIDFIDGKVYQTSVTKKTIYLSNGTQWNAHTFHQARSLITRYRQMLASNDPDVIGLQQQISKQKLALDNALVAMTKRLDDVVAAEQEYMNSLKRKPKAADPLHSQVPTGGLRYVIMETDADNKAPYVWVFANRHTGHYELAQEFKEANPGTFYNACGGGFYNYHNNVLELYGKSSTYGLRRETFNKTLPYLIQYLESNIYYRNTYLKYDMLMEMLEKDEKEELEQRAAYDKWLETAWECSYGELHGAGEECHCQPPDFDNDGLPF